ncbi:hypothetical protein FGADI_6306 [Fusarium gaditjirri]|uniref:Uncharacterized protein n=1 Tax=Fusarium gaditjirri TaxID=282569 RepID=A0A8H4T859_9HYPO|nr:hypothetical protein FGADI_6306 [Fusarium gaditjirri]
MTRSEKDDLSAYQLQRFVDDIDSFALSVDNTALRVDREALLAEIDGMHAALNYLENTEIHISTPSEEPEFASLYGHYRPYSHYQLPDLPEELLLADPTQISTVPQEQEDTTQYEEKASD